MNIKVAALTVSEKYINIYMDKGTLILMGDMNVQIFQKAQFGMIESRDQYLIDFLNDNNLVPASALDVLMGANPTFVSFDGKSESHIDHIILPYEKCDLLLNYNSQPNHGGQLCFPL